MTPDASHPAAAALPQAIFCPACAHLLLAAPRCLRCGWERPVPPTLAARLSWQIALAGGAGSGLTLHADELYLLTGDHTLLALSAETGEQRWAQPGAGPIHQQPAVAGDWVALGAADWGALPNAKTVRLYARATGAELWQTPLPARQISDPLLAGGLVFVATSDGLAWGLALDGGRVRWRERIAGCYRAAPALAGDLVLFGGDQGVLTACSAQEGRLAWTFQAEAAQGLADLPFVPSVVGDTVYVTCWNRCCYALDAASGAVKWVSAPTEKRPPMTPPVVVGDRVYFCGHDRYVYCLDRATGQRVWIRQLPKRADTPPVLIGGALYVAALNHQVYALDPERGEIEEEFSPPTQGEVGKAWAADDAALYAGDSTGSIYRLLLHPAAERDPLALEQQQRWREAAAWHALAGNYARAGEIYRDQLAEPLAAAQLYERGGDLAPAAQLYAAGQDLKAARRLYEQIGDFDQVGELAQQAGDLLAAAQAFARAGLLAQAGWCYYNLRNWPQAASMYEQAAELVQQGGDAEEAKKCWQWAGTVYEHMQQYEKAVSLYRLANQPTRAEALIASILDVPTATLLTRLAFGPLEAGRRLAQQKRFVLAAQEYLRAQASADAAAMFEQAGEFVLAAEQYQAAGKTLDAARMMAAFPNWERAAQLYQQGGDHQAAAAAFLQANDHRSAAEVFETLGAWPRAAAAWAACQRWEEAAQAWEKAGLLHEAAQAWNQAGELLRAAECCWRAAQAAEQAEAPAPEAAAALYDQAWQFFHDCGDRRQAESCDKRRRYLRKQPWLQVEAADLPEFVVGESDDLLLFIHNVGWGMARKIEFTVSGEFKADLSQSAALNQNIGLAANMEPLTYRLFLIPHQAGRSLPMNLHLTYQDARGRPLPEVRRTFDLAVREKAAASATPSEIHYHGTVVQTAEAGGIQVVNGDAVNVNRGRSSAPAAAAQPAAASAEMTCPQCGLVQPASAFKCSQCHEPF